MATKKYEFHEAAEIFPLLKDVDPEAWVRFVEDIKKNGQQEAIVLLDGKVIDGRNRYLGCLELGLEPKVRVEKIDDPVTYVVSRNLHRRHLTASQYGVCAAKAKALFDKAAAARKAAGQKAGGKAKAALAAVKAAKGQKTAENKGDSAIAQNCAQADETNGGKSAVKAGEAFGVSENTVLAAEKVLEQGSQQLVDAVEVGDIKVSDAAKIVDLPKSEQTAAVKAVKAGTASTVAEAAGVKKPPKKKPGSNGAAVPSFKELYEYVGRSVPKITALDKRSPGGKFTTALRGHIDGALKAINDWQQAVRSAKK